MFHRLELEGCLLSIPPKRAKARNKFGMKIVYVFTTKTGMIQPHTRLRVADNSGASRVMSIRTLGGNKKYGRIGDVIIVTVKKSVPNMALKRSQLARAVIVRTKQALRRSDGSRVRFDDNAAVIVGKDNKPVGTRVFGPVARELKARGFSSVVSLSDVVI